MENTANAQLALIQHGYGILAIVDNNSFADLTSEAKSNDVEMMDYELDTKRPYTQEEIENLPFNPANFIGNIADGELYVTNDTELISEY